MARASSSRGPAEITRKLLKSWQLEAPKSDDSKDERGQVLVIGGEREIPGAILLSGLACLRAGAGKLQIATCSSAAVQIGIAVPEARVIGLEETPTGSIRGTAAEKLRDSLKTSQATLMGPGMMDTKECASLLERILPHSADTTMILDAGALPALGENSASLALAGVSGIITPHAGEMAKLLGVDIHQVHDDPSGCAIRAAESLNVVVILKGPETHVVSPGGDHFVYRSGDVGLATSGSGDILAGIVTGLAARTGDSLQSAVWGVFLHGEAGNALAKKRGRVGYLARELLDEIPPILNGLSVVSG